MWGGGEGPLLRRAVSLCRATRSVLFTTKKGRDVEGIQTLVFLDEIHRFNKLQQDALLEDLELGHFILI